MKKIILAAVLIAMTGPAFATEVPEISRLLVAVPQDGVGYAAIAPTTDYDEILYVNTDQPKWVSIDKVGGGHLVIAVHKPGICPMVSVILATDTRHYRVCSERAAP